MAQGVLLDPNSGSPRVQGGYEVGNVLGRLNADKPFIGKRVVEAPEYARIVRYVLNAIDGYHDRSGDNFDKLQRHIRKGRIEVRCVGSKIVVVTPG